jgi:hypothetical protein
MSAGLRRTDRVATTRAGKCRMSLGIAPVSVPARNGTTTTGTKFLVGTDASDTMGGLSGGSTCGLTPRLQQPVHAFLHPRSGLPSVDAFCEERVIVRVGVPEMSANG